MCHGLRMQGACGAAKETMSKKREHGKSGENIIICGKKRCNDAKVCDVSPRMEEDVIEGRTT